VIELRGQTRPSLRKSYSTATRRLQTRGSERIAESLGDDLWTQIDDVFHRVTREVVNYAESVENPVLVLENLTDIRESMDNGAYVSYPRLKSWASSRDGVSTRATILAWADCSPPVHRVELLYATVGDSTPASH
jgi:hypothetical protein